MGRPLIWVVASMALLTACVDDSASPSTTTTEAITTTRATPADRGRLVTVDASGDIVVMAPDGSERQAITNRGDNPSLYMQPVWSPDGSLLAWGQRTGTGFGIGIARPETGESKTFTTPDLPFYTYWSPDSRHLGVLHNGNTGVQFQIVDTEEESTEVLDEDAPFYFSWSPLGDRVVTHAGASRAETITPDGDRVELAPTAGSFLSPQWTDSGTFHVARDELVLEDDTGRRTAVAAVSGLSMFVANPQGSHVALQTTGDGAPITASAEETPSVVSDSVVVVEVDSGALTTVDGELALGFFWSPDGGSLLVLTASDNQVVPLVWGPGEETRRYTGYQPTGSMLRDTFPFFPQYAQSVSFWAPDASAFTFAGTVDGERGIWVQPVDGESPAKVDDGTWVAWSPARP